MKLNRYFVLMTLISYSLISCDLADPIESTITEYAEFEVTGGQYLYVEEGTSFEDPGVVATAGEDVLDVQVQGTVDTNTPGVYSLTYSALNAEGFPATTTRYVAVGNKTVAESRDLSGTYSPANTLTKLADGFYRATDILPPNNLGVVLVDLGNGELIVPLQSSRFGNVVVDPSVDAATSGILHSDTSFTLNIRISGYNIFVRTFSKQ